MGRGFVLGALSGLVVSAVALVAASFMFPIPPGLTPPAAPAVAVSGAPAAPAAGAAPEAPNGNSGAPALTATPAPAPGAQPAAPSVQANAAGDRPEVGAVAGAPAAPAAEAGPSVTASAADKTTVAASPGAPAAPAGHGDAPQAPALATVQPGISGASPGVGAAPAAEAGAVAVPGAAGAPAGAAQPGALAAIGDSTPSAPAAPQVLARPGVPAASKPVDSGKVRILRPGAPAAGFQNAPGVMVNRLPQVGGGTATAKLPGVQAGSLPGQAATVPVPGATGEGAAATSAPAPQPPVIANAVPAANPDGKPEVAVILLDQGGNVLDREALAASKLPVSFAVDPTAHDAGDWATTYHDGGHEVLLFATSIPRLATPSDLNVTFSAYFRAAPQAVGVIDLAHGGFSANRLMAQRVVSILAGDGYGLVTYRRGLDAAEQVARRAGVPAAQITAASDRTDRGGLSQLLDRAAFRAGQEGRTVIALPASEAVMGMLAEWARGPQGKAVALVPVTAVMRK